MSKPLWETWDKRIIQDNHLCADELKAAAKRVREKVMGLPTFMDGQLVRRAAVLAILADAGLGE